VGKEFGRCGGSITKDELILQGEEYFRGSKGKPPLLAVFKYGVL